MSEHANTAKAIRRELKQNFPNVKFKVTSHIFAGGDSVNIDWVDGVSVEEVDKIVKKYQAGSFDGMQDLYEYDNKREDIPQVKYVQTQREISEEKIKEFREEYNKKYFEKLPEGDLSLSCEIGGRWINAYQLAHQTLYHCDLSKPINQLI